MARLNIWDFEFECLGFICDLYFGAWNFLHSFKGGPQGYSIESVSKSCHTIPLAGISQTTSLYETYWCILRAPAVIRWRPPGRLRRRLRGPDR